jgi:hypothetical protein
MTCPLFNDTNCRFCSHEMIVIPFSPLVEKNGRLVPGSVEHRKEEIGPYCNNVGDWCKDLPFCPARWGLYRFGGYGVRADGCGVYMDSQIIPGDIFLIEGTGQQTLGSVIEI